MVAITEKLAEVRRVLDRRKSELAELERDTSKLEAVVPPFVRLDYGDAVTLLQKKGSTVKWGDDLGAEDESLIVEDYERPVFVMNYPKEAKAFYMKENPADPRTVLCDDCLAPEGYGEIIGGSQREDDHDKLLHRIKEEGLPLSFPGTAANFGALYQCTDALLLARAIAWMSSDSRCANQAFNIINGDYIRWRNLWPVFAEYFGMEPGPVEMMRMADAMPGKKSVWERIVRKHDLAPTPYKRTALWSYGDFVFEPGYDIISDTTKARLFGFHEALDTQRMFIDLFDYYRQHRIIP